MSQIVNNLFRPVTEKFENSIPCNTEWLQYVSSHLNGLNCSSSTLFVYQGWKMKLIIRAQERILGYNNIFCFEFSGFLTCRM